MTIGEFAQVTKAVSKDCEIRLPDGSLLGSVQITFTMDSEGVLHESIQIFPQQ